jgi:formamidopyrimidine-DNA glycosylase
MSRKGDVALPAVKNYFTLDRELNMPELPDVEVFKRYLDATALHKTITAVEVKSARILRGVSIGMLQKTLRHRQFQSTHRHGKHLLVALEQGPWLTLHFGMTGYLKYFKQMDQDPEHDRLLLSFANGFHLAYVCQRKLGAVGLTDDIDSFIEEQELGPDVLSLDPESFRQALQGRRGTIKSFFLNQKYLAGLGNVYADEILFQSKLHPQSQVHNLEPETVNRLYQAVQDVLHLAIDAQADPDRFPDSFMLPHRRRDGTCPRCQGDLKKISVAGRSGYYCPACQTKPA